MTDYIEEEQKKQREHPEFYYTAFDRKRCSPLCDGHCIRFMAVRK